MDRSAKFLIFAVSLSTGLLSLFFFWYFGIKQGDPDLGRTMAFAVIASDNLIYIFAYKNLKRSIIQTENFFKNTYMFWAVLYGFALIFVAIYVPFFNKILGTVPLDLFQWALIIGVGLFATLIIEIVKIFPSRMKIAKAQT